MHKFKVSRSFNQNKKYVSIDGVLYNKDMTEIVIYPLGNHNKSYVIPENIENLYRKIYNGNKILEYITFNNKIKEISHDAFGNCINLKEVNNIENIIVIGISAFNNCTSLEYFTFLKILIICKVKLFVIVLI